MAAPALYLAVAIVILGSLAMLAEQVAIKTQGAFNRSTYLTATMSDAAQDALAQTRSFVAAQVAAGTALSAPSLTPTQPAAKPGIGAVIVTFGGSTTVTTPAPYGNAALGGAATSYSQSIENDSADPNVQNAPAAGGVLAPRYAIEIDVKNTAPDGSTDDVRAVCAIRTYPVAPYADLVSCTPRAINAAANSQFSADVSGTRTGAAADTSTHKFDVCNDPSNSGACEFSGSIGATASQSVIDRSIVTTQSGTAAGASTW